MTPFSKVKTWIKQGFYEKLPASKSSRGALDLEQEIMDTLVRKGLATTEDCCTYSIVSAAPEPEYLEYLAFVEEGSPIVTTVFNANASNYLGDITWTEVFTDLVGTRAGAFTTGKTFISVTEDWNGFRYPGDTYGGTFEEDTVYITTKDSGGSTAVNNANFYVMIRVYS